MTSQRLRLGPSDFGRKVFDIHGEERPKGAWWWWFWLFFFDNPKDPCRPRQLMVLWSTKNVREIVCNDLRIRLDHPDERGVLDGAVASWYFDGERMHHNFLLDQCMLNVDGRGLVSASKVPTSFTVQDGRCEVRIGDGMEFTTRPVGPHEFTRPIYHSNRFFGRMGYSILKWNRLDLDGRLSGMPVRGSAYFQRVFVNAPAVPWYWGIFHFENGGILTYFDLHLAGRSLSKDISFMDGSGMHEFRRMRVERSGGALPRFRVSGENEHEDITFTVRTYSHSSWTFRKRSLGIIPNRLVYNEYPAVIDDLTVTERGSGERTLTLADLGTSVGNAEHTTGLLF